MNAKERTIPQILLGVGVLIFVVHGFRTAGTEGATATLTALSIMLALGVVLGIIACFITAKIMDIDFGPLNTAVFKLAAIFLFPEAVSMLIPWPAAAWIVSVILYYWLLMWLFEIEFGEALVCAIVIWVVRLVAILIVGTMFLA